MNVRHIPPSVIPVIVLALCFCQSSAASSSPWVVARNARFEVYSQTSPESARSTLVWFEQLRSFFQQNGIFRTASDEQRRPPLKVIAFSSKKEYNAFKIRATADAFYTGTADRDYIVMPLSGSEDFRVAAHEYAHFVLHSEGLKLPAWLNEGLAEFFSTLHIEGNRCELGGDLPMRSNTLRRNVWFPASNVVATENTTLTQTPQGAALYYAESWAITDMLLSAPEYSSKFATLISSLNSGLPTSEALTKIYGKTADLILSEAQTWITRGLFPKRRLPLLAPETVTEEVSVLSEMQTRSLLAEILLATGKWDRAHQVFTSLLHQSSGDPDFLASLGAIALYRGDRATAIGYWRKALDGGIKDASLCYRYALLAEESCLPLHEIERALQQAIANQPRFDDARYRLALLKSNAGEYAAAVEQMHLMARPSPQRAFAYWTALSYALAELGKRDEAESAAQQAFDSATTSAERARATELKYVARTDLAVQFARNAADQLQLVTTRIPHGSINWNPFIEAGETIQKLTGQLNEVICDGGKLSGIVVEAASRRLTLSVPDPTHVLIRNGPPQYSCGPQVNKKEVKVEFAPTQLSGTGLLRGMQFQ